ncbi:hypothetical protein [Ruegeria sp. HKCCD8929]|uniref:hypothetical protein n=1 Tax=Ruegeria sp. HKCCD8929 TaxID=2683006 RepID=UPI001489AA37|nr:hypothetical protein [Ruegeria sp. HKCCD8929]
MRYIDEYRAENAELKAARFAQLIEFRLKKLKERVDDNEATLRAIVRVGERVPNSETHAGAYLAGILAINGHLTDQETIAQYYIDKICRLSLVEAVILLEKSGFVPTEGDVHIAEEIQQLERLKIDYRQQINSVLTYLCSVGLLVDGGRKLEPTIIEILKASKF